MKPSWSAFRMVDDKLQTGPEAWEEKKNLSSSGFEAGFFGALREALIRLTPKASAFLINFLTKSASTNGLTASCTSTT